MKEAEEKRLVLTIDGGPVPMNEFVRGIIEGAVRGIISSLKGVDPDGEISLTIKRKPS